MILLAFLAQTLRIAIPYLLAAAGGVMSERAGLIALTLEGYMLGGAFCAVAGELCYRLSMGGGGRCARRRRGARAALRRERDPLPRRSGRRRHRDQSVGHRADAIPSAAVLRLVVQLAARARLHRAGERHRIRRAAGESARLARDRSSSRLPRGCCTAPRSGCACAPSASIRRRRRRSACRSHECAISPCC